MKWKPILEKLGGAVAFVAGLAIDLGLACVDRVERLTRWAARSTRLRRLGPPLRMLARDSLVAVAVTGLLWGAAALTLHRIPPGVHAVRQVDWGGGGIQEGDHGAGFAFTLRGRDTWHHLDARTHVVCFAWASEGGTRPALQVATADGEALDVAVTVPYRIRPGQAWELVRAGIKSDYEKRATAIMKRVLLARLSELTAEEFADPDARLAVSRQALASLNEELAQTFLVAEDVLIGGVYFAGGYEKKMLERQLASQVRRTAESVAARRAAEVLLAGAQHDLAQAEARLVEEWEQRIEELRLAQEENVRAVQREVDAYDHERRRAAEAEYEQQTSAGEFALASAEALREQLMNEALETPGGRLHLAREAASKLRIKSVTLNSNDPRVPSVLDLDALVKMLIGGAE
jgi:outer membrane murein-binding lipoprotein Lpp